MGQDPTSSLELMRHLKNTANCSGTRTDILFCLLTLFDSPWFICWKWRYNTNFYSSMLFKKLITLFAEKQLWYTVQTAQAWLGNSVQPNGSKTFLFNRELPPEKLKYLTLNWTVVIIKWKREWKDLSRNIKPYIISYALPRTRSKSSKLLNQDKNKLWDCKYHKAAIMLTDRALHTFP